ncbi:MAG: glycosyltransferase family 2 protein [Kiritimatiellae bacterium]|nr:glycosyltransferase family 2 protein [Kiritimatiellia bacterium]
MPELSIVIPVYNSEGIFPELHRRLAGALEKAVGSFEIVAVVDGCRDRSFDVIAQLAKTDPRIRAVEFSRNFGHQAAITAGLEIAAGGMVAVMDDDLEDPPEVLPQFIAKMREGYDVVYGVRRKRKRSPVHRFLYSAFYRVLGRMADVAMPRDAGDFCLMSRRVVDVLNSMPESNRYLRGLRAWSGFAQTGLEYERSERFAGETGYSLRKYFLLALDAVFSFSYKPLAYLSVAGVLIAVASFLYALMVLLRGGNPLAPGWASLFVLILFFSGIQLLSIGIIGQYLARIYDEVKRRPKFIVKRAVGVDLERGDG